MNLPSYFISLLKWDMNINGLLSKRKVVWSHPYDLHLPILWPWDCFLYTKDFLPISLQILLTIKVGHAYRRTASTTWSCVVAWVWSSFPHILALRLFRLFIAFLPSFKFYLPIKVWHEDRRIFIAIQHRLLDRRILIAERQTNFNSRVDRTVCVQYRNRYSILMLTSDVNQSYLQTRYRKLLFILSLFCQIRKYCWKS